MFRFKVGQKVRILKTLTSDTYNIEDMLGKEGTIIKSYKSGLARINWYNVKIGDRIEPFKEYELDYRYSKKSLNNRQT